MIIKEVIRAEFNERNNLDETVRSVKGFGHTGVWPMPKFNLKEDLFKQKNVIDFIQKPFRVKDFLQRVEKALNA